MEVEYSQQYYFLKWSNRYITYSGKDSHWCNLLNGYRKYVECACVRACVRACRCACVRVCVRTCVYAFTFRFNLVPSTKNYFSTVEQERAVKAPPPDSSIHRLAAGKFYVSCTQRCRFFTLSTKPLVDLLIS